MRKRPTYQFIKDSFEEVGYTLLSTEYKPNIKLEYICPSGHNHSITWASWKKGTRCFYCSSQVKPTIQDIKILFELEGYKLISKEYKGAHSKLFYTCSKGHDHSIAWHEWKKGQRCGRCKGNIEITFEYITVCSNCNKRANTNREWHQAWYETLMKKRFNK